VRGEYGLCRSQSSRLVELPPRARRIRLKLPSFIVVTGTTSACAENTEEVYSVTMGIAELPPRARRIRPQNTMEYDILGTTSACAENTTMRIRGRD